MTRYGIWHKAGPKLNDDRRGMIKFSYFRTAMPKRDWVRDSDEIPRLPAPRKASVRNGDRILSRPAQG